MLLVVIAALLVAMALKQHQAAERESELKRDLAIQASGIQKTARGR